MPRPSWSIITSWVNVGVYVRSTPGLRPSSCLTEA
jgi:hypothetical protein